MYILRADVPTWRMFKDNLQAGAYILQRNTFEEHCTTVVRGVVAARRSRLGVEGDRRYVVWRTAVATRVRCFAFDQWQDATSIHILRRRVALWQAEESQHSARLRRERECALVAQNR